jgi:hypothetical protein
MKSKIIQFVSTDNLKAIAVLRWQTKGKDKGKVFVSYAYAFEQCDITQYLPKNLSAILDDFCTKNNLILWSY